MSFLVYILFSEKLNRYYTGYTTDFEVRFNFHLKDDQARKFTYNADDWVEFLRIECTSKNQALAIEKHIKRMKSKTYIENLNKYPEMRQKLINQYLNC